MSQYYNYRTALLILFMSLIAFLTLVLGIYYNDSLMGHTPQGVRYLILGMFELLLLLPLFFYVIGNGKSIKHAFRVRPVYSLRAYRDILFVTIGLFITIEFVQYLMDGLVGSDAYLSEEMKVLYPLNYIPAILVFGIITPLVEESLFRGYFLRVMLREKISPGWAIIFQALVFSVAHLSFRNAPSVFLAGIILGFLAYSFYSIVPGIIIHSIFNILALININNPRIMENIIYGPAYVSWLIVIGGMGLLVIALVSIRKNVRVHHHRRDSKEGVGYEK